MIILVQIMLERHKYFLKLKSSLIKIIKEKNYKKYPTYYLMYWVSLPKRI